MHSWPQGTGLTQAQIKGVVSDVRRLTTSPFSKFNLLTKSVVYIRHRLFQYYHSISSTKVPTVKIPNMKLSLFAVLLIAFAAREVASQACHLREVDLCMAIGMFHFQSNGVPSTGETLDELCESMKEVSDCMGNYTGKCMSPMQRELISLFSGAEDPLMRMCTPGSEPRARYLKHSACIAEAYDGERFKSIMQDLEVNLEKVFEVEFYQRLPGLCCGMKRLTADLDENTEVNCGKDAVEMTRFLVTMLVTDIPDVICQRYEYDSAECQELLPPRGSPSKGPNSKSQIVRLLHTVFGSD